MVTALAQQPVEADPHLTHDPVRSADPRPLPIAHAALVVKIAAGVLTPLVASLAVLAGIGSFATIRHLAVPWFGNIGWIVPVGIDIGIFALLAWDLLAEYLGFPWPVLRWTAWAFTGGTVYLNVAAAHGSHAAAVMHAAMPILFVTVFEGIRHLIRQWTGLADETMIERIRISRWLLAPWSSFSLKRRMVLWQVTSYRRGLILEHQRLQAVARLQEEYGRFLWRWKAPLRERLALRLSWIEAATYEDIVDPVDVPAALEPADDRDQLIIATANGILRDAREQGQRLGQLALAKRLREEGHAIANDRLRWLMTVVDDTTPIDKDKA
ncbi:MAG TPA: DUF2637 domain-containing protein [Streptosporangiaceae bacterium]